MASTVKYKSTAKVTTYKAVENGDTLQFSSDGSMPSGTTFDARSMVHNGENWLEIVTSSSPYKGKYIRLGASITIVSAAEIESSSKREECTRTPYSYSGKIAKNNTIAYTATKEWEDGKFYPKELAKATVFPQGKTVSITEQSSISLAGNIFYKVRDSKSETGPYYWVKSTDVIRDIDVALQAAYDLEVEETINEVTKLKGEYLTTGLYSSDTNNFNLLGSNLMGIHGAPYQFMSTVDNKKYFDSKGNIKQLNFGRKYAERIIANMPLVLFSPGEPDFLSTFGEDDKTRILTALLSKKDDFRDDISSILSTSGRYYTFKFKYNEYYKYVNDMLRQCAVYLGIQNKEYKGSASSYSGLGTYNWENCINRTLKNFIYSQEYVAFYADSESSISESISTSTTQSQLASATDSWSAIAKEIQFLAGPIAGVRVEAMNQDDFNATMEDIRNLAGNVLGSNRLFNNLAEGFATVGKGAKLLFPEIWDDTTFTKSYRIQLKFRTPDADVVSWYFNICVPLIHILCLAAPRGMGPNGYRAPFIVRAFSKGLFNCDMGIITNMSINKGREGAWTIDGLPTEVDVEIDIKDLYETMFISNSAEHGIKNFINNTAQMDYIANLCGININKPEIERTLETYLMLTKNKIPDTFSYKWLDFKNTISNTALKAYQKLGIKN